MDRNRFNSEVRPRLTTIPIGIQGIAFDRIELDNFKENFLPKMKDCVIAKLGEKSIVKCSRTYKISGVYFLIAESRIVYIGRSFDIMRRIANHRGSGKVFDRVFWILKETADERRKLEAAYIRKFKPPYNNHIPR